MQSVQYYSDLPYFVTFFFLKQIKAILTLNAKGCLCSLPEKKVTLQGTKQCTVFCLIQELLNNM